MQAAKVVGVLVGVSLHNVNAVGSVFGLARERASLLLIKSYDRGVSFVVVVGVSFASLMWPCASLANVEGFIRALVEDFKVK